MQESRKIKGLRSVHVEAHHSRTIRVGRTGEPFLQDVAAVFRRLDPPVVESACRHVLPRVVVVDLDMFRTCMVARIADDGLGTGGIGEDRRRAWLGESQLTEEIAASAHASLAATYSDSGVECATVKIVYDFQEIAAQPIRNT